MKRILTAAILIPLVLLAVLRAPLWLFLLISALVALAAVWELLGIAAACGFQPFRGISLLATAAVFAIYFWGQRAGGVAVLGGLLLLLLFVPYLLLLSVLGSEDFKAGVAGAAMSSLALPYIAFPLLLLAILREAVHGWIYVLFTFFAVWVGDIAALYVGKSMGRHKLAPRISPGKTVEGTLGSLVFSVAICCLFAHFVPEIAAALERLHLLAEQPESLLIGPAPYVRPPLWLAAVVAAAINLAAQVGDLVESAMKRAAGLKDSGAMLPGHGGMLDRIDALLLACPMAFVLFMAFGSKFVH